MVLVFWRSNLRLKALNGHCKPPVEGRRHRARARFRYAPSGSRTVNRRWYQAAAFTEELLHYRPCGLLGCIISDVTNQLFLATAGDYCDT